MIYSFCVNALVAVCVGYWNIIYFVRLFAILSVFLFFYCAFSEEQKISGLGKKEINFVSEKR